MNEKIDAGPIIMKKKLLLKGSIGEIIERMKKNDLEIIDKIILDNFKTKKQKGKSSIYKRRVPKESEIFSLDHSKKYIYDFIRMLEDPYPNAFLNVGKHKIVFKHAKFKNNKLNVEVEIE
jgi:methionyl-tRNA formyltransferase